MKKYKFPIFLFLLSAVITTISATLKILSSSNLSQLFFILGLLLRFSSIGWGLYIYLKSKRDLTHI